MGPFFCLGTVYLCHREGEARGDLLVLGSFRYAAPGDCHAALRLAMTVVICGWFFWGSGDDREGRPYAILLHTLRE